jgi:hypothetical protein
MTAAVLGIAGAALAPAAEAAPPVISGTYIVSGSSNCQAVVSVTKNAEGQVIDVNISPTGALNAFVVTATFRPETGRVLLSGTGFDGPLAVRQGDTRRIKSLPIDEDWAYSNTETTVTLRGIVYQAAYGKRVSNVVQQFTLAGREENNRCAFGATLIRK